MYNMYIDQKKSESLKNASLKRVNILKKENYIRRTNNLVYKYQKRIKKFILDVRYIK